MLKQLFCKVISFFQGLFGRKSIRPKTRNYPANSGGFAAMYGRGVIEEQQAEIQQLKRKLAAEEGQFRMVDGERKYVLEEDQRRFNELKHRNLGGIILQALLAEGLQVERTVGGNPNGDLRYPNTESPEGYEKMKAAFAKLQAKFDAINKAKKSANKNGN